MFSTLFYIPVVRNCQSTFIIKLWKFGITEHSLPVYQKVDDLNLFRIVCKLLFNSYAFNFNENLIVYMTSKLNTPHFSIAVPS